MQCEIQDHRQCESKSNPRRARLNGDGPDQHGGRGDRADDRKLSSARMAGVDQPDPVRPRYDIEAAPLTSSTWFHPRAA